MSGESCYDTVVTHLYASGLCYHCQFFLSLDLSILANELVLFEGNRRQTQQAGASVGTRMRSNRKNVEGRPTKKQVRILI